MRFFLTSVENLYENIYEKKKKIINRKNTRGFKLQKYHYDSTAIRYLQVHCASETHSVKIIFKERRQRFLQGFRESPLVAVHEVALIGRS